MIDCKVVWLIITKKTKHLYIEKFYQELNMAWCWNIWSFGAFSVFWMVSIFLNRIATGTIQPNIRRRGVISPSTPSMITKQTEKKLNWVVLFGCKAPIHCRTFYDWGHTDLLLFRRPTNWVEHGVTPLKYLSTRKWPAIAWYCICTRCTNTSRT